MNEELSRVGGEEWTDFSDVIQEEPACQGHCCDVLGEGQPVVQHHSEIPLVKSETGMKISSILPGLSFRWWLSIQLWMSHRQIEIQVETCVSDGGKERKDNNGMSCHEQK